MKKNELLSALRSLQNIKNRTALAVTVGVMAMLLLLLSENLRCGKTQEEAVSAVRKAADTNRRLRLLKAGAFCMRIKATYVTYLLLSECLGVL